MSLTDGERRSTSAFAQCSEAGHLLLGSRHDHGVGWEIGLAILINHSHEGDHLRPSIPGVTGSAGKHKAASKLHLTHCPMHASGAKHAAACAMEQATLKGCCRLSHASHGLDVHHVAAILQEL